MYTISEDNDKVSINCLWQMLAGQFSTRDPTVKEVKPDESRDQSHDRSHDTAIEYHYGDIFYMGEINYSGNSIVVEEREKACTMLHLFSAEGKLIRSSRLDSLDGRKEVHTHMISSSNNGHYVIMTQGGYALVVNGEELELMNTIKLVSHNGFET